MGRIRTLLALFSRPAVALGVVAIVVAAVVYISVPQLRYTVRYLLIIGLVFLLLFVLGAFNEIRQFLWGRKGRYGVNTLVMILIFIGIAVLVNALSARNHQRFDVTEMKQYTLSPQTIKILKNLKAPIKVVGFFTPEYSLAGNEVSKFLAEYMFQSDKITVEFVDPEIKPTVARQYEIIGYPVLVFESDGRRQQVLSIGEQEFTTAILEVTGEKQKKVYFLTGHGERSISDDTDDGYGEAGRGVIADNSEVATLNLATEPGVPGDAAVLVIASPESKLAEEEMKAISEYLDDGGKAFILLDPGLETGLEEILANWGLVIDKGVVVDFGSSVWISGGPVVTAPLIQRGQYSVTSPITSDLDTTFFPDAVSISPAETLEDYIRIYPLAVTTENSWVETDENEETIRFDEDEDKEGPLAIGVEVYVVPLPSPPPDPEERKDITGTQPTTSSLGNKEKTRLVVLGNSAFASGRYFSSGSNGDLFLNSINWLAEEEELISIRPKGPDIRMVVYNQRRNSWVWISSFGLLPLVVLIMGGISWWRRR